MKLNTLDEQFITLLPPNFDNEVLIMNNMQITYLVKKINQIEKISIYLRKFNKHTILAETNVKNFLYQIGKANDLKLFKDMAYPKQFFKLIIYTPDANHSSELILKACYKKKYCIWIFTIIQKVF